MQLMTIVFMCGLYTLIVLEMVQWAASALKPAIGFRGVRFLASHRVSCKLQLQPSDKGKAFSTSSCDVRIVGTNDVLFTDRKLLFRNPWLLKGRIVSDGTTWLVEIYGSLTFWVLSGTLLALWGAVSWGSYLADGIQAGSVAFVVGAVGLVLFRLWYGRQLHRTADLVTEVHDALELRSQAWTEDQSA